jgi:hypothetical protein
LPCRRTAWGSCSIPPRRNACTILAPVRAPLRDQLAPLSPSAPATPSSFCPPHIRLSLLRCLPCRYCHNESATEGRRGIPVLTGDRRRAVAIGRFGNSFSCQPASRQRQCAVIAAPGGARCPLPLRTCRLSPYFHTCLSVESVNVAGKSNSNNN